MPFTDGKPWIATKEDCALNWNCGKKGEYFRCGLCGKKFKVGDTVRWLFTNNLNPSGYGGNPFVCQTCDGPDVIEKWKAHVDEWNTDKFWLFHRREP